jgi:phosphoribosylaminoimidazolecarboxamide formyltransferase / IMP cyclohydrolase
VKLRYGTNPHQTYAAAEPVDGEASPLRVLSGAPSYINLLDALNGWNLVREARAALGQVVAASFKHVSPAGVATGRPGELDGEPMSAAAMAYALARDVDPKSSYGDVVALSDPVDVATARHLAGVVSDGIVAPGYEEEALSILAAKKRGSYLVIEADPSFEPPARESRDVLGLRLVQDRDAVPVTSDLLRDVVCGTLTDEARRDLLLGLVTLRYTQSNSVAYVADGQVIGIGAGQQSRIDCTRLAGTKADVWHLRRHPRVLGLEFKPETRRQDRVNWRIRYIEGDLTGVEQAAFAAALARVPEPLGAEEKREWLSRVRGVSLVSDGFLPFRDNVDEAQRHGVAFIAEPGASTRAGEVEEACRDHGIALVRTGLRLFHH